MDREARRSLLVNRSSNRPDKQTQSSSHQQDTLPAVTMENNPSEHLRSKLSTLMEDMYDIIPTQNNIIISDTNNEQNTTFSSSMHFKLFSKIQNVSLNQEPQKYPNLEREYEFSEKEENELIEKFNQVAVTAEQVFQESNMKYQTPKCWEKRILVIGASQLVETDKSKDNKRKKTTKRKRFSKRRKMVETKIKKGILKRRIIAPRKTISYQKNSVSFIKTKPYGQRSSSFRDGKSFGMKVPRQNNSQPPFRNAYKPKQFNRFQKSINK